MSEIAANLPDERQWEVFRAELHSASQQKEILRVIADSGPAISGADRIILAAEAAGRFDVIAASGVRSFNPKADEVVRLAELCQKAAMENRTGQWIPLPADGAVTPALPGTSGSQATDRRFRIDRLPFVSTGPASASSPGPVSHFLILESQSSSVDRIRRLPELHREVSIALSRCYQLQMPQRQTWRKVLIGGVLVLVALVVIPWEFELEVPAIAFPIERRNIFAPENGIVDQIRVSEGASIDAGQTLLTLTNSELSMQFRQVQGERDTVSVRLRALGIARTAAASGSEIASELIREELQLQQKLRTLEEEVKLLQSQLESLNLKAPISGVVFQRRLDEQLDGRPVQRGQLLLEVGNVEGNWELELKVPASSAGYVPISWGSTKPDETTAIPVRFRMGDARTNQGDARLTSISMAAEVEDGRLICKAYAKIEGTRHSLRPGEAVTARISCGKRSLGFVLFRDVVQFLRRMWFVWT